MQFNTYFNHLLFIIDQIKHTFNSTEAKELAEYLGTTFKGEIDSGFITQEVAPLLLDNVLRDSVDNIPTPYVGNIWEIDSNAVNVNSERAERLLKYLPIVLALDATDRQLDVLELFCKTAYGFVDPMVYTELKLYFEEHIPSSRSWFSDRQHSTADSYLN